MKKIKRVVSKPTKVEFYTKTDKKVTFNAKRTEGQIKEAKEFSKELILIKSYAIQIRDEHGEIIYTFPSLKKRDEFFKELKNHQDKLS